MAEADPPRAKQAAATLVIGDPAPRARTRHGRTALMIIGPLALIGGGLWYWFGHPGEIGTDNANVKQDIVSVAAEITGQVTSVRVHENQHVHAGDILFTINPANFQASVEQADAQVATAQARITALQADVHANTVDIASARDDLALAQANFDRGKQLMDRGFNTRASMDEAEHAVAAARDKVASLEASEITCSLSVLSG